MGSAKTLKDSVQIESDSVDELFKECEAFCDYMLAMSLNIPNRETLLGLQQIGVALKQKIRTMLDSGQASSIVSCDRRLQSALSWVEHLLNEIEEMLAGGQPPSLVSCCRDSLHSALSWVKTWMNARGPGAEESARLGAGRERSQSSTPTTQAARSSNQNTREDDSDLD